MSSISSLGGITVARAWAEDCHYVLMQSGRADPRVHNFYERLGFVPGLRTGYVANLQATSCKT